MIKCDENYCEDTAEMNDKIRSITNEHEDYDIDR